MRFARKKRQTAQLGPRSNQWTGQRAELIAVSEAKARRSRVVRLTRFAIGAVMISGILFEGIQHTGPLLNQLLAITTITVEGLRHLQKQEVLDRAKLKPGIPLHHIVTTVIKEQIESHPWVKEAVVTRAPLHELKISIVERKPAAIIRTDVQNFLSDDEGHVLAQMGPTDDTTLPLLTGIEAKELRKGDESVRQTIMSGIEIAELVGHTFDGRLQVDAEDPSSLVASVRGVRFQFGEEAFRDQWERFQHIYPTLKMLAFDGRGDGPNEVDLRFANRIIVREGG